MRIAVRYFAALREQRGISSEELETDAVTTAALFAELRSRHRFSLNEIQVRFAVNGEYVGAEHTLREGDEVVFVPPVAGG
ncbi:MAG: molybdopterin converting factor subunit 1 [Fimbriimonadaceae bacterium]|nr:molybdopterin converting factor subunit 1 [Fimbriimonadaceae bacterium]